MAESSRPRRAGSIQRDGPSTLAPRCAEGACAGPGPAIVAPVDLQNVTWDPVLLSLAAFLAVCAIYLLFLRNAVMWGFLCILGIVGLFVVMVSPDMLNNR